MQPAEFTAVSIFQDYPGKTACYGFPDGFCNIIDRLAVVQNPDWTRQIHSPFAFDIPLNIFVKIET